jgi:hypothetical protein
VLLHLSAALDARAEFEVLRRFDDLARGRTAILISSCRPPAIAERRNCAAGASNRRPASLWV